MRGKEVVSIIIPTWNNYQYLSSCLSSLLATNIPSNLIHIYVVNNGEKESCDFIGDNEFITVLNSQKGNLGWEGGLKLGLENSNGEYVMFLNDDVYVPTSSMYWVSKLLAHFRNPKVGAVGPSTNVVMGVQNIFQTIHSNYLVVPYLIGFCLLTKRSILEEVGGIDDTLPGGDDLDLSIRLKDKGYQLIADRSVFIYHHGFKTGERIHGGAEKPFGWNSYEFKEKTDFALIRKHGFRKWYETIIGQSRGTVDFKEEDKEGNEIRKLVDDGIIVELGCGGNKTIENAIGIDLVPKGEKISSLGGIRTQVSQADIVADVSSPLPFQDNYIDILIARHLLEHLIDNITVLFDWFNKLKSGGKLILALPDEEKNRTIPMNIEHKHAYTKKTIRNLLEAIGFKIDKEIDPDNNVSFIISAIKP